MDDRVRIEQPTVEYSVEGSFESHISKEYLDVQREIDVFYQDFIAKKEENIVPVEIFSQELSPLQALVKYLKEEKNLSYSRIARLTNRDPRTIWATHDAVRELHLTISESDIQIPVDKFSDRNFAPLECLVNHLILEGLSVSKIASLLGKNYQTIWTVKRRIREKGGGAA